MVLQLAKGTGASTAGLEQVEVSINSEPAGADIDIDGDFAGNTPAKLTIDKGRHTLRISRQGYQLWEKSIMATPGLAINPHLEKTPPAPAPARVQEAGNESM
jgi:hypothetical protein